MKTVINLFPMFGQMIQAKRHEILDNRITLLMPYFTSDQMKDVEAVMQDANEMWPLTLEDFRE